MIFLAISEDFLTSASVFWQGQKRPALSGENIIRPFCAIFSSGYPNYPEIVLPKICALVHLTFIVD
jgi:hypothetical protein